MSSDWSSVEKEITYLIRMTKSPGPVIIHRQGGKGWGGENVAHVFMKLT